MVMVVADARLETRWRSCGLNAADQTLGMQNRETVVDRLKRDRADLFSDGLRHGVGGDVGLTGDSAEDRQTLRGYLNAALAKEISWIDGHTGMLSDIGITPISDELLGKSASQKCHATPNRIGATASSSPASAPIIILPSAKRLTRS